DRGGGWADPRDPGPRISRRGRSAPRDPAEHQALDRHRQLSWRATSQGYARARAAHAYQRAHPPRTPRAGDRYQEEDSQEVTFKVQRYALKRFYGGVMAKQQAKGGAAGATKRQRGKRREKKNVPRGQAHIQSTFNNTIVTITDPSGNVICWSSAGQ